MGRVPSGRGFKEVAATVVIAAAWMAIATACTKARPFARIQEARDDAVTPLLIRDVTVIDVVRGHRRAHQSVLIEGNRIVGIESVGSLPTPVGGQVVDGTGRYLIPGLWDMHTHSDGFDHASRAYPVLVAAGILGVRDMGSPLEDILRIRSALREGTLMGPRLILAGPLLQGPLPFSDPVLWQLDTPESARAAVDSLQRRGVDFIKVGDIMPAETWDSVLVASRQAGLSVAGHVPPSVSIWHAAAQGQASVEHFGGRYLAVLLGGSTAETHLRQEQQELISSMVQAVQEGRDPDDTPAYRAAFTRQLLNSLSRAKLRRLLEVFRQHHTWQVPTLGALPVREVIADTITYSAEDRTGATEILSHLTHLVGEMQQAGVGLLAGTDLSLTPDDLVRELALLVDAGLTPAQALQTATINPARFLGAADSLGSVGVGRVADLVLLDADPLLDIRNVSKIRAVVQGGRLAAGP